MANTSPNQHSSGVEVPKLIRINPSFIEHVVYLFFHLSDNCCNSLSSNRADRVSDFQSLKATAKRQQLSYPMLISRQKRSGTRAITNGGQLLVCVAKLWQFHAKCNLFTLMIFCSLQTSTVILQHH